LEAQNTSSGGKPRGVRNPREKQVYLKGAEDGVGGGVRIIDIKKGGGLKGSSSY